MQSSTGAEGGWSIVIQRHRASPLVTGVTVIQEGDDVLALADGEAQAVLEGLFVS